MTDYKPKIYIWLMNTKNTHLTYIYQKYTFDLLYVKKLIYSYFLVLSSFWLPIFSCQANISVVQMLDNVTSSSCEMESRPSIVAMVIHVLSFFGAVIAMSSWTWTRASLEAWERLFRKWDIFYNLVVVLSNMSGD